MESLYLQILLKMNSKLSKHHTESTELSLMYWLHPESLAFQSNMENYRVTNVIF